MAITVEEVIDMINKKTFGAFVREKRMEKGLTQRELAEQLFISESAVSKWEMGKSYPDITLVSDICRVLDVSEKELIDGATDTEYQSMKREAKLYRRISKTYFWVPTIAYAVALVACLASDLAINHALTFSPVVFGSLLVAFSFIPTWTRFTDNHKLAVFVATTFGSIVVLFGICCLMYQQDWFGIAAVAVLLGYVICFGPVLLRRYLPEQAVRYASLIYFGICLAVLIALLAVIRITVEYDLGDGLVIALYCAIPFAVVAIMHCTHLSRLVKAAIDIAAFGVIGCGVQAVVARAIGDSQTGSYYHVDFADWAHYANGNIMLVVLIVCVVIAAVLFALGMKRRHPLP